MKFWALMPFLEPEDLLVVAQRAEDAGFVGVALADHATNPEVIASSYPYGERLGRGRILPSPLVMIAAMAATTRTLRFTTWVLVVPLRHPVLLAKEIATAARIAGPDRLDLGIGIGWMREEFEILGVDPRTRARRMDEMVDLMRRLWRGEFVTAGTVLFDMAANQVLPTLDVPPPILVGGHSPAALRRAGRMADGWVGAFVDLDELAPLTRRLERARALYGRLAEPFEIRLALTTPPTPPEIRRLEDLGVGSVIVAPWHLTAEPSSLPAVLDGLSRFDAGM